MAVPQIQTSFAAGEMSPSMYGHVDYAKYSIGCSTLRNMYVGFRGGAYSRAGTAFVGFSKQTGSTIPPRLIPFQFSINQGLALEFGQQYMRVIFDGALVTEAPISITGISQANPGVVSVANTWVSGDWVYISGVAGMTQVNGQTYVVESVTGTHVSLYDVYGNPINTTAFGAYTSGGTAARVYVLPTPWAAADLEYLKYTQSADVMSLTCWNQQTGTLYPPYDLARVTDSDWVLTELSVGEPIAPPNYSAVNATVHANAGASPPLYPTAYAFVVTAVDRATGQESIASPIANVTNSVDISETAGSLILFYDSVVGAAYYNIYKAPAGFNTDPSNQSNALPVDPGNLFGYAGTSYGIKFVDSNIVPDLSQVPPLHTDPFSPGQILALDITSSGSNITTVTYTVTTSTGSGFAGYPIIANGGMSGFIVTNNGQNYSPGDSIAFNGAGYATGAINFSTNPSNNDTVTLDGVTWTFKTTYSGGNQTVIKSTLALTLQQLASDLSQSSNATLNLANYTSSATALTVTYATAGTAGNSFTLAASAATPTGATLTGGGGTGGTAPTATLVVGPQSGTYPGVVSYFQERRVYASSPNNPDTYWMSQPGAFTNFDSRIPTIDSDAITGSPWSVQVNGIQAMIPMPGGLVVLTGLAAYQLTGAGGSSLNPQPITPSGQQAQPQAFNGCSATVPPIKIDYDINYVQAKGSIYRDLSYNFFTNIYTGTDLTFLSSHLFTGYQLVQTAWCEEPYRLIWAVRNDGTMLSLTYFKQQDVIGWARHDTNGLYCSVCNVTEPPVDALYTATQRFIGSNPPCYMIERMDDRIWAATEDAWCVDAGLSYPQPTPNATLTASSATGLGACTGVTGLIGGSGYSSGTTAVVVDNNGAGGGSGATVSLTISSGVITGVSFPVQGTGYSSPKVVVSDPANTGSGFSAKVTLSNAATFTASAAVFSGGNVGSVIRTGGGIAVITAYTDSQHVTANILSSIRQILPNSVGPLPLPQTAGNWSMTAPTTTVSGLNHLAGALVTGVADGNVITPQTVSAAGTITLGTAASSIIVGLGYTAQLQSLYLNAGAPTVQGRRKKVAAVTVRMEASAACTAGTNQIDGSTVVPPRLQVAWKNLDTVPNKATMPYNALCQPLYTGDTRLSVKGGFQIPGQVALQQSLPQPMNVLAIIPELDEGDTPEVQAMPSETGRSRNAVFPNR